MNLDKFIHLGTISTINLKNISITPKTSASFYCALKKYV